MLNLLWRCALALTLLGSCAAGAQAAAANASDGVAVIIGNAHYGKRLPAAAQATRDAAAVRDYLIRERGFQAARMIALDDAARGDIAAVFLPGGALERLVSPGDGDVFVYFSGHGVPTDEDGPALLGTDGRGYELAILLARVAALPARRVTVVIEAGFSGISHAGPVREPAVPTALPPAKDLPNHVALLTAADAGQVAGWDSAPGGGLFTTAVLAALSGGADGEGNGDGRTTLAEVDAYLAETLPATAARLTGRPQKAVLRGADDWVLDGPGPVLAADRGEARVLTSASLRHRPTARANRLEVLAPGARLTVLGRGRDRNWLQVRWRDVEGFVFAPLLTRAEGPGAPVPPVPDPAPRKLAAEVEARHGEMLLLWDVPLRAGPGASDEVVQRLSAGERLRVTSADRSGTHLRVLRDDGLVGFLPAAALTPALDDGLTIDDALRRIRAGLGQSGSARAVTAAVALDDELIGEVYERLRSDFVDPMRSGQLIDAVTVGLYRGADAETPDGASLTQAAIDAMIGRLDRHSAYLDPKQYRDMQVQVRGEFAGLGIEVTMEDGKVKVVAPIDHTPAARAGLRTGDLISHLDGEPVQGLTLPQAVTRMRGLAGTSITLTVERAGQAPFDVTIVRDVVRIRAVRWQVRDDVGYLRITTFNEQVDDGVREAVAAIRDQLGTQFRGLILDLRNNPGGLLKQAVSVSDIFLDKGEIVSLRGRAAADNWRYRATRGDDSDGRPMLVLINEGSASASEIVAAALQDHRRALVVGTTSFGKGSVQTIMPLRNDGALRLTTARYYRPAGGNLEGDGVHPDVEFGTDGLELDQVIDRARQLLSAQAAVPMPALSKPTRH